MFCSTSIGVHLLRGLAALALLLAALYFSSYGIIGLALAALAAVGAIVLLRGCPMCWLVGLFETLRQRKNR